MACESIRGRTEQLLDDVGGIRAVYLTDYGLSVTEGSENIIIDLKNSSGGIPIFSRYFVNENISNFEQTEQFDQKIGMGNFEQNLTVRFKYLDSETNYEIKKMLNKNLQAVINDNSGKSWLFGKNNGMHVNSGESRIGKSPSDLYGYTVSFDGIEQGLANYISGSTIDNPFGEIEVIILPDDPNIALNVYCFISNIVQTFDGQYLEEGYGYINNDYFYMDGDNLICSADNASNFQVNQQTGQLVALI